MTSPGPVLSWYNGSTEQRKCFAFIVTFFCILEIKANTALKVLGIL